MKELKSHYYLSKVRTQMNTVEIMFFSKCMKSTDVS